MKDLKLTEDQKTEICIIIGDWYLDWKTRGIAGHFGYAKEDLKTLICEGMTAFEFSKKLSKEYGDG